MYQIPLNTVLIFNPVNSGGSSEEIIMKKRQREKNYTPREKRILLELVKKSKVLEDKGVDKASRIRRDQIWRKIAGDYNAVAESGYRDPFNLKVLLRNMQDRARRSGKTPPVKVSNSQPSKTPEEEIQRITQLLEMTNEENKSDEEEKRQISQLLESMPEIPTQNNNSIETVFIKTESEPEIIETSNPIHISRKKKKSLFDYSSDELKKIYLRKKIDLVNLQMKHAKIQHFWEMKLKRAQLNCTQQ